MIEMIERLASLLYNDVLNSVVSYLPIAIVMGIVCCVIYTIITYPGKYGILHRMCELVVIFMLSVYVIGVVYVTLLSRTSGLVNEVDLEFFSHLHWSYSSLAQELENIILFVPYGLLLPMALPRVMEWWWVCVPLGFLGSLAIETTQMITGRGLFQLDDLLMNTLGFIAGYWLFCILEWIMHPFRRH